MHDVVMVSACRTPIGSFQGSLKDVHVKDLGKIVGTEALRKAGMDPTAIDEVVCGNVIQAGVGGNIARQIQGALGIPWSAPACTVNQLCASAMRALEIACHNIMTGCTSSSLVLGVENMTRAPYLMQGCRSGYRMGSAELDDAMMLDALVCSIENYHMGVTAENIARRYSISRKEQDDLALLSQQRAAAALQQSRFVPEIVPVEIKRKKETVLFDTDEHVRPTTTADVLASLKPVFKKDGTVTAGNASGVNDGAAAAVLLSAERARQLDIKPLARIRATASAGVDPSVMGLGPAVSIPKALDRAGLAPEDIGYYEINEAFAAQFLGVERMLQETVGISLDMDTVNRNGSGISLGHPVGCTGLRVVVSLLYEMQRFGSEMGCASLCAGGGPSMATVLQIL